MLKILWKYLILPKSASKDKARREFILNILLVGAISLSGVAFFINLLSPIVYPLSTTSESPLVTGSILILLCFLLLISRFGSSNLSAISLISLLYIVGIYVNYRFGADLGQALLLFALLIVMAGVLISTKSALIITVLSGLSILLFSYLEINNLYNPNNNWKFEPLRMADSIVYVITLGIIAIVSWLSNREIERALKRAWRSEAALRRQRDNLEVIVEKRTNQLKQAQVEKLSQLYRFAEFGRISSGIFHDLVNPLTSVSLSLATLKKDPKIKKEFLDAKFALDRAINGTKRLEGFINAARHQMRNQTLRQKFSLRREIAQTIQIFEHRAKKEHIQILFDEGENITILGDPIKFNQLVTNLITNAFDAYFGIRRKSKIVKINLQKIDGNAKMAISDWGSGIKKEDLPKIFTPLFTTKNIKQGTGIGLSICKEIVEKDLSGKIKVLSKRGFGTTFTVEFSIRKQ